MMISAMRRATVPVPPGEMDRNAAFFKQVLGMKTFFDKEFTVPGQLLGLDRTVRVHIQVLQQGDARFGMVGLIEYLEPSLPVRPFEKVEGMPYPVVFVFYAQGVPEIHRRALEFGAKVTRPPMEWDVPGKGRAGGMLMLAPNGVLIELTELPLVEGVAPVVAPMRRCTVPVSRGAYEPVVSFYKEVLGLESFYEAEVRGDQRGSDLGVGSYLIRMNSLQQGNASEGMMGVIEYLEPNMPVTSVTRAPGGPYPITCVYFTDDCAQVLDRLRVVGARLVCPPVTYDIPGAGSTTEMSCLDPNGVLLNFVQPASGSRW